ncbi:hypothetical protein OVY01_08480 [Robbsia sp. Bb-Pol-6]|uniref:Uncharacterized protein n=1 Tax=Robbsia betulipollinis TaxID=2981849 RepID=A0ABT3ZL60_9BURK|nr:hypothetical protein [Robbsia betulipollinis]MCY0387269.1 hypothetical protein [Robbsia betulipollinis]
MIDLSSQPYALDRGLDRIDYVNDQPLDALPAGLTTLLPPGRQASASLRQLLDRPDLTDYLESAFEPQLTDHALLGPQVFSQALHGVAQELQRTLGAAARSDAARETSPGAATDNGAGAGGDRILARALRVVRRELDLRAEVTMNWNLLHKG